MKTYGKYEKYEKLAPSLQFRRVIIFVFQKIPTPVLNISGFVGRLVNLLQRPLGIP